jgi:hypothetical protein
VQSDVAAAGDAITSGSGSLACAGSDAIGVAGPAWPASCRSAEPDVAANL